MALKQSIFAILLFPILLHGQIVPKYGNDTLIDVATWNVEWFGDVTNGPSDELLQYNNVKTIINRTDLDVWGFEEMSNPTVFTSLTNDLPQFGSVNSTFSQTQKMSLFYKKNMFNFISAEHILSGSSYDFASRLPLLVRLATKGDSLNIDTISFIVIHLKANSDATASGKLESYNRRKRAADALKIYIESVLLNKKYIVLGDWNDRLDFSIHNGLDITPFKQLLNANYNFISKPLADAGKRSYAFSDGFIDHIMVSPKFDSFYVKQSAVVLDNLGQFITNYSNTTSDHYPVFGRFVFNKIKYTTPFDSIPKDTIHDSTNTSLNFTVKNTIPLEIFPNPFESTLTLKVQDFNDVVFEIYSPTGKLMNSGKLVDIETKIDLSELSNGLYFVKVKSNILKIIKT